MRERINESLKQSLKSKDQIRVSTLRLILAAVKDRDIAARSPDSPEGVSDEDILSIMSKMVKQRRESAQTYEEAGRLDLAEQERQEIEVIEEFMPQQLMPEEIEKACKDVIAELQAQGLKDMGKCMGTLKQKYSGQMDFAKASGVVKELLSSH